MKSLIAALSDVEIVESVSKSEKDALIPVLRELVNDMGRYWKEGLMSRLPSNASPALVKWAKGWCARYWKKIQ